VASREAVFARIVRTIEHTCFEERDSFEIYGDEVTGETRIALLAEPTGSGKSTEMRKAAVRFVTEHPGESVVIFVPRHKLGTEQIKMLHQEHPDANFSAAIWRGRNAPDPDGRDGETMCQRADDTKKVQDAMLDVEHSCCKQGRGKRVIKCPLYDGCAWQGQKEVEANIWFCAHEMLTQAPLKAFGKVGLVMIDESPLDAFIFGVDYNDQLLLPLDELRQPPPDGDILVSEGREALYQALHPLRVPISRRLGVPPARTDLHAFIDRRATKTRAVHIAAHNANELHKREFRNKVIPKPEITPTMTKKQIAEKLLEAAGNKIVRRCTRLFKLISQFNEAEEVKRCGRIQVHRGDKGREIRMVGLRPMGKGWSSVRTLISDATGDAELLRQIWPHLTYAEDAMRGQQLPRPANVRVFQMVDRTFSKYMVAVESIKKDEEAEKEEIARKTDAARRLYAALLHKALEYGGADVGVIVYKSTEDWIRDNCFIPDWLKLLHHGDTTGTDVLRYVRAMFTIGRTLPPAEIVTQQAEALYGVYIPKREYRETKGRIPIVPDAAGNTHIEIEKLWKHPDPRAERLRWQACEGGAIQADGRARAGLRGPDEPLDTHRWTDLPVPELGPVIPVLWDEVDPGIEGLMLATGGVWLECMPHAVKAYAGLFTVDGLKQARRGGGGGRQCVSLIGNPYKENTLSGLHIRYQRAGERQRLHRAFSLMNPVETRSWLEDRLGKLKRFEVITDEARDDFILHTEMPGHARPKLRTKT
jgi:hypothetical protein